MSEQDANRIYVYLRVRPKNKREIENKMEPILTDVRDPKVISLVTGKDWGYDGVLYDDSTQPQAFKLCMGPLMKQAFKGMPAAVLAYGQTGSGKTHTTRGKGTTGEHAGFIPRIAEYIFDWGDKNPKATLEVNMRYVQIYLGRPRDLLDPHTKKDPDFRLDGDELVFHNCVTKHIKDAAEFMKVADHAEQFKVVRATAMNPESSRGHSSLVIDLNINTVDDNQVATTIKGRLFVVDLAGYEQAALIGQGSPELVQETKHINETLLGLNRVMNALAQKEKRIPYREYRLTMMLKDALSIHCRSTVIITMSPALEYKQQTYNTLYFGKSAMSVKVEATVTAVSDYKAFALALQAKLKESADRIQSMGVWFQQRHPKEWERYVNQYGNPEINQDDVDDILDKIQDEHENDPIDEVDTSVEAIEKIQKNASSEAEAIKQIEELTLARKQKDEKAFQKELDILRGEHEEEIKRAREAGKSAEEINKLMDEQAFEIRERNKAHFEHGDFMTEQVQSMKQAAAMKFAGKLLVLGKRAKATLAKKQSGAAGTGAASGFAAAAGAAAAAPAAEAAPAPAAAAEEKALNRAGTLTLNDPDTMAALKAIDYAIDRSNKPQEPIPQYQPQPSFQRAGSRVQPKAAPSSQMDPDMLEAFEVFWDTYRKEKTSRRETPVETTRTVYHQESHYQEEYPPQTIQESQYGYDYNRPQVRRAPPPSGGAPMLVRTNTGASGLNRGPSFAGGYSQQTYSSSGSTTPRGYVVRQSSGAGYSSYGQPTLARPGSYIHM